MSPTIFRERGVRFLFFSREERRMHVHAVSQHRAAKFWLEPALELAGNHGFSAAQLRELEGIVEAHYDELVTAWRIHFSD
jgi:hypothetical protein